MVHGSNAGAGGRVGRWEDCFIDYNNNNNQKKKK